MNKDIKIGFIGCGKMASAIIGGLKSSEIAAKSFPVITEHNNTEDTLANTETTIYIALYIKVFFVFSLNINEFNMQAYTNKNIELKYAIFIFIKN